MKQFKFSFIRYYLYFLIIWLIMLCAEVYLSHPSFVMGCIEGLVYGMAGYSLMNLVDDFKGWNTCDR